MLSRFCILTMLVATLLTGTVRAEETNPVLGKVGDFSLREADLDRIIASQPPTVQKRFQDDPQQRLNLVREILIKKAVVAKAKKERFDRRPEIKEQLTYVFDNFVAQEYLSKVVVADIAVPEEDLKKYYQEHENEFSLPEQVKVRHILISLLPDAKPEEKERARTRAEAVLQRLAKGEDFAALASEFSDDQNSSKKGGELAPITRGRTNSQDFEKAAFALKTGASSGIVTTEYGLHIINVVERQDQQTAPFQEAKDFIHTKLRAELEQKKIQGFVEQAIKEAGLEVYAEKGAATPANSDKNPGSGSTSDIKK